MPNHLHRFCAPHDLKLTLERWISICKERFANASGHRHFSKQRVSSSNAPQRELRREMALRAREAAPPSPYTIAMFLKRV